MKTGGIVLCGGRSSRMGRPKAWLPFGDELMLPSVVRILREVVNPVIVVAAPDQDVPSLPAEVEIVRDEVADRGPLQGLAAGLAALQGKVDAAYLSACDVPFLKSAFVRRVVELLEEPNPPTPFPKREGGAESSSPPRFGEGPGEGSLIAIPFVHSFHHPLAAVYRIEVLSAVRKLLGANRLRTMSIFESVPTRLITEQELGEVESLRNLNSPEDYAAALRDLAVQCPPESRPLTPES